MHCSLQNDDQNFRLFVLDIIYIINVEKGVTLSNRKMK